MSCKELVLLNNVKNCCIKRLDVTNYKHKVIQTSSKNNNTCSMK